MGIFKITSWMARLWLCNAICSKERDNYPNLSKHLTFLCEWRIQISQTKVKEKSVFSWFGKHLFLYSQILINFFQISMSEQRRRNYKDFNISCLCFCYYAYSELKPQFPILLTLQTLVKKLIYQNNCHYPGFLRDQFQDAPY